MAHLLFEVAGQKFAIPSGEIREVLRACTLTPLVEAPPAVSQALTLRGRVVPVVDLRTLFALPAKELEHTDHLVVLGVEATCALRVDRALDLVEIADDTIEPPPQGIQAARQVSGVARTEHGLAHLLDARRLLALAQQAHSEEDKG